MRVPTLVSSFDPQAGEPFVLIAPLHLATRFGCNALGIRGCEALDYEARLPVTDLSETDAVLRICWREPGVPLEPVLTLEIDRENPTRGLRRSTG